MAVPDNRPPPRLRLYNGTTTSYANVLRPFAHKTLRISATMNSEPNDLFLEMLRDAESPEELDPDLVPFLCEHDFLGTCLKHPLVFAIPYVPMMNKMYNASLNAKVDALAAALQQRNWTQYLLFYERPYRIEAFYNVMSLMEPWEYWEQLGRLWIDSENIREFPELWEDLLRSDIPHRQSIMTDEERDALDELPETFIIYQGHTNIRDDGWSWTTEKSVAVWFARRFASMEECEPRLTTALVEKRNVIAYFLGRNESEIVVDPDRVQVVRLKPLDDNGNEIDIIFDLEDDDE